MQASSNAVAVRRRQKPTFEFICVYIEYKKKSSKPWGFARSKLSRISPDGRLFLSHDRCGSRTSASASCFAAFSTFSRFLASGFSSFRTVLFMPFCSTSFFSFFSTFYHFFLLMGKESKADLPFNPTFIRDDSILAGVPALHICLTTLNIHFFEYNYKQLVAIILFLIQ